MSVDYSTWKNVSTINCKAVNEDPAWLNVGSHRRSNQPNLKSKTMTSPRLLQGWHNVVYLKLYFGWTDQPSSGLNVNYENGIAILYYGGWRNSYIPLTNRPRGPYCKLRTEYFPIDLRPGAAFSKPQSQFFTIRTFQLVNNIYISTHLESKTSRFEIVKWLVSR